MLDRLRQLLGSTLAGPAPEDPAGRIRLCVTALLVELARADFEEHPVEHAAIVTLVRGHFALGEAEAEELLHEARAAVADAVSLREFTAPLHEHLSYADKQQIIAMLWSLAAQDRNIDKYEDYLIGKLAELLYVSRGDVIRLRHQSAAPHSGD